MTRLGDHEYGRIVNALASRAATARRLSRRCLVVLFAMGIAGCGGGNEKSRLYTLSATQSCLRNAGYGTSARSNFSLPGSGGNLRVQLRHLQPMLLAPNAPRGGTPSNTYVFLVFDKDLASALATEKKAIRLAQTWLRSTGLSITQAALKKSLGLNNNVFYYSTTGSLSKSQRDSITSCLR